jgi:hypothetical protein
MGQLLNRETGKIREWLCAATASCRNRTIKRVSQDIRLREKLGVADLVAVCVLNRDDACAGRNIHIVLSSTPGN